MGATGGAQWHPDGSATRQTPERIKAGQASQVGRQWHRRGIPAVYRRPQSRCRTKKDTDVISRPTIRRCTRRAVGSLAARVTPGPCRPRTPTASRGRGARPPFLRHDCSGRHARPDRQPLTSPHVHRPERAAAQRRAAADSSRPLLATGPRAGAAPPGPATPKPPRRPSSTSPTLPTVPTTPPPPTPTRTPTQCRHRDHAQPA